ncbi:hypothetical protein ACFFRR_004824 [Megaselia abdita]
MPPKKDETEEEAAAADNENEGEAAQGDNDAEPPQNKEADFVEEEEEGECISRTGVESVDSVQKALDEICEPKLKKNYLEYLEVVKQIQRQNLTCQRIKDTISKRCCNDCRSDCEEREIRVMRCCLEKENLKLTCLMQQAMRLQGEDPDRNWKEVIIATTIDEDFMPTQMDMNMSKRLTDAICNKDDLCAGVSCDPCSQQYLSSSSFSSEESAHQEEAAPEPTDEVEDFLRCLLRHGDKGQEPSPCGKMNTEMVKTVLSRMAGGGGTPYESARSSRRLSESSSRDKTVHNMQRKIHKLQGEVGGLISKRERMVSGTDEDQRPDNNRNIKALEKTISRMQKSVDTLKNKLMSVTGEKAGCRRDQDQMDVLDEAPVVQFTTSRKPKTSELKQLRTAFNDLKLELVQKNAEISDMRKRMKPLIYRSAAGTDNPKDAMEAVERSEVMVLRAKKNELEEEQEEFKCLIKEQAEQLDDYRRKYMEAQQKFEEQKVVIGKMDMNNKRVEEQINSEVQRIKSKFQEKIAELSQYPCILESEQLKLAQVSKEKDDLEGKLKIICKELKAMQAQKDATGFSSSGGGGATSGGATNSNSAGKSDCSEALRKCKIDYGLLEKQHSDLMKEKDKVSEQLQKTKQDLDTLRTESAKIIARTKERAECTRHSLQEHVDKIEKELAQCRANACLSVSDREEVIKEMTGQMNTLSFSFDAAQKQIKSLKTQIGFLAHDNSYPVKS